MNVDDFKDDVVPTDFSKMDMLDYIFARQHALYEKYLPIETANGLRYSQDCPVNLHDRFGQAQLKDMFWRVTEELTEAIDAARIHRHIPNHTLEELADALHFLVEALLLSGITPTDIVRYIVSVGEDRPIKTDKLLLIYPSGAVYDARLEQYVYEVIHAIGCAGNFLKQRPWKQSHFQVDVPKYREALMPALPALMLCFRYCSLEPEQVFAMYWKKSEVNKFRMRSNY